MTILQNAPLGLPALLAMIAFFGAGVALIMSVRSSRDEALARRVEMVEPGLGAIVAGAAPSSAADSLFRLPTRGLPEPVQREIIRRFSRLGITGARALTLFVAFRLGVVFILGALALLWAREIEAFAAAPLIPVVIAAVAAIIGWFVPMMLISRGVKQRNKAVRAGLPDALELLIVCVEAGLSLEDGLDRIVVELKRSQPALADELGLTLADLKILPSRDQALANLAARVDVPSVRSVVNTLSQTLRYGTPLVMSLRVVASEMRNDSLIELEDKANKLPALLTLPVIVFLMPTIFLIVGGPAALRLMDAFLHR
jgi:tight adherence protein C